MNLLEWIADDRLLGALPAFRDQTTWRPWLVFLRAVYGLPLSEGDLDFFRHHTGRRQPRSGGYPEAVAVVGRQSGKSRVAAAACAFEAATSRDAGTVALLVSQDQRAAQRVLLRYAREPFHVVPVLRREVLRDTNDTVDLASGVSLCVYPCRPAAVRGVRASIAVVDELAFFIATDGRPTDTEMLRALRPSLATTGGKLLILSSPYAQAGALWDLHRAHYGRDDSPVLVWQATAPEMNPTLPADYLERMAQDDPDAYRSEVLGEFRAGVASLFDPEALEMCVARGVRELPPAGTVYYKAFADPSGGRSDAFALAIGHRATERIVVDAVRAWPAPFNPSGVVEEAAALVKSYDVGYVVGDRYAGEWAADAFRKHGISYIASEKPKRDLYLDLLPVVNSHTIDIPDVSELIRELRGLHRRRGPSGRDQVDHQPGSHDDRANAVAGLASLLPRAEGNRELEIPRPRDTHELQEREYQRMIDDLYAERRNERRGFPYDWTG